MLSARHSFASVPRGRILAALGVAVVAVHLLHLLILALTATPAHHLPIIISTLAWVVITAWAAYRGAGMSSVEMVAAICCGAAAITADGIWGGAPGHAYLVSTSLVALVLAVGAFSTGRTALVGNVFVLGCQCALLLAVLGTGALGVYVALATTAVTGGACLITWSLQGHLIAMAATARQTASAAHHAAAHDPLTGLLNRRGMAERFSGLRVGTPQGHRIAAAVLDLDHFKRINDLHGHDVGDAVLLVVAQVLRDHTRRGDAVVRLGGEELAWLGAWPTAQDALHAAEQLRRALAAAPAPADLRIAASIGVAFSTDVTHAAPDGEALSRLLVRADIALYQAKAAGRGRVVLAAPSPSIGRDPHHVAEPVAADPG